MGPAALVAAFIGARFLGMVAQNAALNAQAEAAAQQANLEIAELDRQRREENRIAQERKADRVREADKRIASIVAALADGGGAGTMAESRFVGEAGFYAGLDLARIEGNRRRKIEALHSEQVASRNRALNVAAQVRHQKTANFFGFVADSAGVALTAKSAAGKAEAAKQGSK